MKNTGGGRFDASEEMVYFLAGSNVVEFAPVHRWNLVAINDVAGESGARTNRADDLHGVLERGNAVLLDSGIFWLTQRHMRANPGMTMDEALALAPDEVEGFDWLWENYVAIAKQFEIDLWGYIELDQGGADNKRKTRTKTEALGLRPIPVYHPLNDGWDYFDELCEEYDRICFGNIVQANSATRRHLLATLWERRRKYPHVWVHVLGLTPNELTIVYPLSSCDSSSWVFAVRFGAQNSPGPHSMGGRFGRFTTDLSYHPEREREDAGGVVDGLTFLAVEAFYMQAALRAQGRDVTETFGDDALLPPYDEREGARV